MRRSFLALITTVSVIALTQIVSAADLPRKAPVYAPPPPAPVYSWTGWYAGLNAGYGWENTIDNSVTSSTCLTPPLSLGVCSDVARALAAAVPGQFDDHPKGFIGGGQIGYNYQFSPNWLAGVEADFQGAHIKGDDSKAGSVHFSISIPDPDANVAGTGSQKIDWFGTLRGRLGWLPVNPLLIYATGGLAYGHTKTDVSWSGNVAGFETNGGSTAVSLSDTRVGWTVGGGLEWMFAPRWSLKAEYLYYDLGTVSFDSSLVLSFLAPAPYEVLNIHSDAHYHGNIVRAGVNYHFYP